MYPISRFMTKEPQRISADAPLVEAQKRLQAVRTRHLIVVDGEQLVGVVSLADVYFAERNGHSNLTVRAAMEAPMTVKPDRALKLVADEMARSKVGAAVVVEANKIVGIFTTIDALHTLACLAAPPDEQNLYESLKDAADRR